MSTPTTALEQKPIEATEEKQRQETDAYLEKRQEEKAVESVPKPAEEPKEDPKLFTDNQAVDAYLREREKGQRQRRGGRRAQFDQWTRERTVKEVAHDADIQQLKAKVADIDAKLAVPKVEEKKEEPKAEEKPKEPPKMAEYTDIDKYNADMAVWAAQQAKAPIPEPKKEEPKPVAVATQAPEPINALRKEELDHFLEVGRDFIKRNPDFNEVLNGAHIRGLTMGEPARAALMKKAAPQVAYWLARPENDLAARKFMAMDDMEQVIEVGKIIERLSVKPSDFVSNAPEPGTRLNGTTNRSMIPLADMDTDDYIRERKLQRKGRR